MHSTEYAILLCGLTRMEVLYVPESGMHLTSMLHITYAIACDVFYVCN